MEAYAGTNKAEEWRETASEFLERYCYNAVAINPTKFYTYSEHLHKTDSEIFRFDLYNTRTSDLILVNLNDIRKSIGTVIELYEAYRDGIPIVGFADKELSVDAMKLEFHPWIYEMVDRIETGEDALYNALYYIKDYYLG